MTSSSTDRTIPTKDRLPVSRSRFRRLIAANPNYFGTFPGLGFPVVEPQQGSTAYEDISCVAYSPSRDRIEATVEVKQPHGYSGGLCSPGSLEHLRFYVDDGGGWQDAGPAAISVHDVPVGRDCPGDRTHPLSYAVGVPHLPRRRWCRAPVLPRVRVILSWELAPPAGQPDWTPIWGTVHECTVQIAPRRFFFGDIIHLLPDTLLEQLPPNLLAQVPVPLPDPDPGPLVPLSILAGQYARHDVPQHRFALPHVLSTSEAPTADVAMVTSTALVAQQAGIDLIEVLAQIEQTSGDTSYEALACLGLDAGLSSLVATFDVKRASGYSGGPCTAGSTEHVAFWADWDDDCRYTYLGTVTVSAHDYDLGDGGLCYAAILPVDLGPVRRSCGTPVLRRVRAVLSWGTAPSTTDPDAIPHWGNRIDRHVQIGPGRSYDGTAHFTRVGGVAALDVDPLTGLTGPGATLGTSVVPLSPPSCPFAGTVELQGPTDPSLAGHRYRVRATNVDAGGSTFLTAPFGVVTSGGASATVAPDPLTGWTTWPTWATNVEGHLGVHRPGGDDRWDYTVELDTDGNDVATARAQFDNTVRDQVLATDPVNAGDLRLFTAGACKQPHGPLTGRFVARDRHFGSWSITVLGGPGGPVPPTPLTTGVLATQQTSPTGEPFTLDLSDPLLAPCGYVVRLTVTDRAVVDSRAHGQQATIDRGICLE